MATGDARERILAATLACIGRYGLARTSVEGVAREVELSRATVYRYFPGGREQLIGDTVSWEAARFLERLAAATAAAPDFSTVLEEALLFAHRAILEHTVLQKVLETEPDTLLTLLTIGSDGLVLVIRTWLAPALRAAPLRPDVTVDEAAEYLARMMLSCISTEGRWDLSDRDQVADLVRTEFVGGILLRPVDDGTKLV